MKSFLRFYENELIEGFRKKDAALINSIYSNDTLLFPPEEEVIKGKKKTEKFWRNSIQMDLIIEELITREIIQKNKIATEWGNYVISYIPEGKKRVREKGKYVAVWIHKTDGTWKKHWDIWNTTL